ncbi:MAG: AraC family transcriptional regulator [Desulfosalsimonadaceae bacterium]
MNGKERTTISTWTATVLQAVQSYGYAAENLLAEAGIDEKLLSDPDARIRIEEMSRLWKLAVRVTGDACVGLNAASHIRPTTFHALGFALMVSSSMSDAFERLHRFYRIVSDAIDVWFEYTADTMAVCLDASDKEEAPAEEAFDMIMGAVVAFARTLAPDAFDPVRVECMRKKPAKPEAFFRFFRSPVLFSADCNRIFFPLDGMQAPLPTGNAEIARGNDQIIIDYLARFDKSRIAHQVRAKLIDLLPLGEPSIDVLASSMGMSTRSLHRHLKKEQATYREILDDIRRYLAAQYLKQRHLSVIEVAFRLGYSDAGNFTRAFKRWFGVSPVTYRQNPFF